MSEDQSSATNKAGQKQPVWKKWLLIIAVLLLGAVLYWQFHDWLQIQYLAEREQQLREYLESNPVFVYSVAFVVYVLITAFSLPIAAVTTIAYGWMFGFWPALILVSFASTLGATLSFFVSRYLFRDWVQGRFGETLAGINKALEREGQFYLLTLRLIPVVPFFVINLVMGLTPMRVWTYWWVSQIGMLPGTAVYIFVGVGLPNLDKLVQMVESGEVREIFTTELILAFALLGIFPLAVKKIVGWVRQKKELPEQPQQQLDSPSDTTDTH